MKKSVLVFIYLTASLFSIPIFSQTSNEPLALGLPGDNLNLYAVLDVFQKSPTLEEFERTLNSQESNINNLDLNNDNVIDYIEVVSNKEGNSFTIILRVAINKIEYQDVAVIEGHKIYSGKVFVQIIGDEELYGKDFIVEPSISGTQNPGYVGNHRVIVAENDVFYVNQWPIVVYLFSPVFSVYVSPWYWGFYPTYWHPWSPVYYHVYWGFHRQYYMNNYYRRASYIRYPLSHSYYVKRRQSSPIVRQHKAEGRYNSVYDGRTYKRPVAPIRRTVTPNTTRRQTVPSTTRQSTRRDATTRTQQSTKQEAPSSTRSSSKPATQVAPKPSSRTVRSSTARPVTRPVTPSTTTRSESRNDNPERRK